MNELARFEQECRATARKVILVHLRAAKGWDDFSDRLNKAYPFAFRVGVGWNVWRDEVKKAFCLDEVGIALDQAALDYAQSG